MTAVLIACAHGTRFEEGRVVIRALLEVLRETAPAGVEVLEAYVDVHGPYVADVVAEARQRTDDIVIVPLLLSTGYHTEVDLVEAAGGLPISRALGPHPVLAEILADRVRATGRRRERHGRARRRRVHTSRRGRRRRADGRAPASCRRDGAHRDDGVRRGIRPRIPDAVESARSAGQRTVAASYVLAPGHFSRVIERAAADLTSEPIGADPRLAAVVWERWRCARGAQVRCAGCDSARARTVSAGRLPRGRSAGRLPWVRLHR